MTLKEGIKARLALRGFYATAQDIQRAIWRNEKAYQRSYNFRKGGGNQEGTIYLNVEYLEINKMVQEIKR